MSKKKNNSNTNHTPRRNLGRMTKEEYEAMWNSDKKTPRRAKNFGRLTDEEYRNLPHGNEGFYKQFTK